MKVKFRSALWGRPITLVQRGRVWYLAIRIHGQRLHKTMETGVLDVARQRAVVHIRRLVEVATPPARAGSPLEDVLKLYRQQVHCGCIESNIAALRRVLAACHRPASCTLDEIDGRLAADYQSACARAALAALPATAADWEKRQARERSWYSSKSTLAQARSVFASRRVDLLEYYTQNGIHLGAVASFVKFKALGTCPDAQDRPAPAPAVVESLLAAARDLSGAHALYFWLAVGAGLRRGEIGDLRWEWLADYRDGFGHVDGGIGKNGRPMRCVIQPAAWTVVQSYRQPGGRVIDRHPDRVCREVNAWMRQHGWVGEKALHGLRAVLLSKVADAAAAAGMDWEQAVVAQARHCEIDTFRRHYSHFRKPTPLVNVLG